LKLLVDAGNSRLKWAIADAVQLVEHGSAVHRDDSRSAIAAVAAAVSPAVESICVASVLADDLTGRLIGALENTGVPVHRVRVASDSHRVRVAYSEPESLGVDRWLAMIAAMGNGDRPVCVASAGTAVTFDALDMTGRHLGGFIWPGPRMAADALEARTDRIGATAPANRAVYGLGVLGTSTAAAVGNGSYFAIAAAIDRAVRIVGAGLGNDPELLLTGGDARTLAPWLESAVTVEPDLVLHGLRIVAAASE